MSDTQNQNSQTQSDKPEEVIALEKQVVELDNKWKRALADYQNLERRISQQQKEFVTFANATLLQKILPVLDDLERASNHLKDDGLAMVMKQFQQVLQEQGVQKIDTKNKAFDPETMEAVERVPGTENKVIEEQRVGYLYHEMVLRPAQVSVGTGTAPAKEKSE